MKSTEGYTIRLTVHAHQQMLAKEISPVKIQEAFDNPEKLYPNKKYAGQFRVVGNGICLVGKPEGDTFTVFTIYEDGILTPPRPDQLETPEGQEYARRYERAVTTGNVRRDNEYWGRVHARNRSDSRHNYIR
ncbi:hypothetical protein SEA_ANNADREAMY_216 [Streptomyces phage Annadreamy]|uniref:Uncharacterized protein n=2 Tax=Annadreamyvirus annadreamy TaxID=2846392 RepID=A0A345GTM9_9CAUD|nr:hypothetical protein HWB75_gp062 [Streptomyces phage Annadreamy]AXG66301.1 hypothetical protein SEA_ANNADREAMY_216 [Streptomyces phage Annadreamy]QGH79524.1 hypothetical protein SEA_LIMPID_223 [Streptomyces phage Limpid]